MVHGALEVLNLQRQKWLKREVRTLHKVVIAISAVFLAIGLVVGFWPEPAKFGCAYEQPYWLTGLVLVVGGAIIAALGLLDPWKKDILTR